MLPRHRASSPLRRTFSTEKVVCAAVLEDHRTVILSRAYQKSLASLARHERLCIVKCDATIHRSFCIHDDSTASVHGSESFSAPGVTQTERVTARGFAAGGLFMEGPSSPCSRATGSSHVDKESLAFT